MNRRASRRLGNRSVALEEQDEDDAGTSNTEREEPTRSNPSYRRRRPLSKSRFRGKRNSSPSSAGSDPVLNRQSSYDANGGESSSGNLSKSVRAMLLKLCRLCDVDIDPGSERLNDESITRILREVHKRVIEQERYEDDREQLEEKYRKYKNMCVRYKKIVGDLRSEKETLQNKLDNIPGDYINSKGSGEIERSNAGNEERSQIRTYSSSPNEISGGRGVSKGGTESMRWLEAENKRLEEQVKYVQEEVEDIRMQLERSLRKTKCYDQLEEDYHQLESRALASERTNRTLEQLRTEELERLQDSELKNVRWKSQCEELRKKFERVNTERQSAESLQRRLAIAESEVKRWRTRCESQLAVDNDELLELRRDNGQKNRLLVRYETRLSELEGDALTRGSRFTRRNTSTSAFSRGEFVAPTADTVRGTARSHGGVLLDRSDVEPGKGGCIGRAQVHQGNVREEWPDNVGKLRMSRTSDYREDLERLKDRLDKTLSRHHRSTSTSPQDNSYSRNASTQTSFPNSRRSAQSWTSQRQQNILRNPLPKRLGISYNSRLVPGARREFENSGYANTQPSRSWRRPKELHRSGLERTYSSKDRT